MKLVFTILIVFVVNFGFSQIMGTVIDPKGEPIPGVSIYLMEKGIGVSTDIDGTFELNDVDQGVYVIRFSSIGYKTLEKKITISDSKLLTLNLTLLENQELLDEVVVNGVLGQNFTIAKLGRSGIKAIDLPQSIYVIDQATLQNQQVNNMQDMLMNTNGVYIMGSAGGYQEEIAGRGFAYRSDNTLKNGVRYFNGMMGEMSGIEKVEILKGSAAILYGNVAAGGVINLITKKPRFDKGGTVGLTVGSFGLLKPSADIYGSLNKSNTLAYRLNGSFNKQASFRKDVSSQSFYINPSLLYKINSKTQLLLEADYMKDRRTPDFGAGIVNYEIVQDFPRDRFLGVKWGYFSGKQTSTTATLSHQINKSWDFDMTASYRYYITDLFSNARPNSGSLIAQNGDWVRNIQRSEADDHYGILQSNLRGNFKTGFIKHRILIGLDADYSTNRTIQYDQFRNYDQINIFSDLPNDTRNDIPELTIATTSENPRTRYGIFTQDLMDISSKFKLLAGIRYSIQNTESNVLNNKNGELTISKTPAVDAFSPRLGVVFQPNKTNSIFVSYSNSFEVNSGVDINGLALKPSTYNQYEFGIKNELIEGKMSLNVTAYLIDNDNLAQQSLANGNTNRNIKELAGSVRSKGIEMDYVASLFNRLKINAGYAFNQTQYLKSNIYFVGDYLRYNPNHTANLGLHYQFSKNLNFGFNGAYIGNRFAGRNAQITGSADGRKNIPVPQYTQVNFNAAFRIGKFNLKLKVANLFNVLSYNVHDDNSVNPIPPRNISFASTYRF